MLPSRRRTLRCFVLAGLLLVGSTTTAQEAPAGYVKVLTGTALRVRNGQQQPLSLGDGVLPSDTLRTGSDGTLGVTLRDNTRLSLGPNTEITLSQFSFKPAEKQLGLVVRLVRGALAFVSGRLVKLAPESIRIETPAAILGVRGTHALIHVSAP